MERQAIYGHNKGLADRILFFSAVGFAVVTAALMKWKGSGPLVLVQSLFAAAIVGGIADWYGVVSIYGRPLGIPYWTEIIVKKWKDLTDALSSFVCDDAFSKKNIESELIRNPLVPRLLELIRHDRKQDGPFQWLSNFVSSIVFEIVQKADEKELVERFNALLKGVVTRTDPSKEICRVARWTLDNNYDDKVIDALLPGMKMIVKNDGFQSILLDVTERFHTKYVGNNKLREWLGDFRRYIKRGAFDEVASLLNELRSNRQHPYRHNIQTWLRSACARLENDKAMQASIDAWVAQLLRSQEFRRVVENGLGVFKGNTLSKSNCQDFISRLLEEIVEEMNSNKKAQKRVNRWMIERVIDLVEKNRTKIRSFVETPLKEMKKSELVAFVREKTENDLQLIRINGMVVGVLIGAIVGSLRLLLA